jgi:DNA-binding MarR family transcriptional regulator
MSILQETNPDLPILEQIELEPDANQATLASRLDVAVGTINWHLKRLIAKGYVKVHRLERKKLRYIITPEGISLRAKLTIDYINHQFSLYRLVRQRMLEAIKEVRDKGHQKVRFQGGGDVAEVCRLTCLEQGIELTDDPQQPLLVVRDLKIFVE